MRETDTLGLSTYDETDVKIKYRDFRLAISGTNGSNMTKIDDAIKELKINLNIATDEDIEDIVATIK